MPETQHARNKSGKFIYECSNDTCREQVVFAEIQPTTVAIACPNCLNMLRHKQAELTLDHSYTPIGIHTTNSRISKNSPDGMGRDYYASPGGIECIEVIESLGLSEGFCIGNAMKYMFRAGKKGGDNERLEDLKKARWYLDRYISHLTDQLPAPKIPAQLE